MQKKIVLLSIGVLLLFCTVIVTTTTSATIYDPYKALGESDLDVYIGNSSLYFKSDWISFDGTGSSKPPDVEILKSDLNNIIVKVHLHDIQLEQKKVGEEKFQVLTIPEHGFKMEVGKPQLPVMNILLAIPFSTDAIELNILDADYSVLKGYNIYPAQEPILDIPESFENNFTIDNNFYSANLFYPDKVSDFSDIGILRDYRVVQLQIYPICFNPGSDELRIYDEIKIELEFSGVEKIDRSIISKNLFKKVYEKSILNYKFAEKYMSVVTPEMAYSPPGNLLFNGEIELKNTSNLCDYLVITHDDFYGGIIPLAQNRQDEGLEVLVANLSDIYDEFPGNNNNNSIRDFINYAYHNWTLAPTYVLLVGDVEYVPTNYGLYHDYHGNYVATDLYYATVAGDDYFPDLFIGRISVKNTAELYIVVEKIVEYPYSEETNWYGKATTFYGTERPAWEETAEFIEDMLSDNGYTQVDMFNDGTHGTVDVRDALNDGRAFFNYRGHGSKSSLSNIPFSKSDIYSLNNGPMYPIAINPTCMAGWYDDVIVDCFGETWVKATGKGGVAWWGASRVSYTGYNDELAKGVYKAIFNDHSLTLGEATTLAKMYMYNYYGDGYHTQLGFEMFNLLGDPATPIPEPLPKPSKINLTLHRIKKIDQIEWLPGDQADWYYAVYVETDDGDIQSVIYYCPENNDDFIVDEIHTFPVNGPNITIKIKLMEDDLFGDDLADVSGYVGGGVDDSTPDIRGAIYHGYYNLLNNSLTGDTTYPDGIYLTTSGEYPPDSSTTTDENDAKIWFSIEDNYDLPIADIGPDKTVGVGEIVNFDASGSTASDGSILTTYEWDWDNDGVYDESYIIPTANHTWTEGGNYTVILRVTDNYNETSNDSCQITVDPARPIALFTYSPSNPFVNQIITFDASSSYDLDGTIDLYEWDWDNDGVYDVSSVVPIVWHFFSTAGYKYVTLRVFDNDGYNDTYSEWIYVIQARFTGDLDDYGLDSDSDGLYDYLVVEAEVEVFEVGYYSLSGYLYYYNNSSGGWSYFDYESNYTYLDIGVHTVILEFEGYKIYNLGYTGSFKVCFDLYDASNWNWIDDEDYITQSYSYIEFDGPPIEFTGVFDDYGLDTDSDGLYDYLVVEAEVEVIEAGEYELSGSLRYYNESSGWWNSIDYDYNYTDLTPGVHTISLEFEGYKIYNVGYNGSFKVDLDLYETTNWNWIDGKEFMTQHYDYTEFQRPIPDEYEPDNDFPNASWIATDGTEQYHDFHVQGDQDWLKFNANEDVSYIIETSDLGIESDTYMYLYALDGVTEITHDDDGGEGLASRIIWDCNLSGSYYIKVRHYSSTACGPDTHYNISILEWTPPAEFTDNFNDYGLDNDGNGLFDYLVIEAEINVSQAEEFYLSGELNYYNETYGTWDWFGCYAWNQSYLDIGIHTVLLEFNGHTINNLGYNGTFRADISLENNLDQLDYAEYYTSSYNYTDFQEPDKIPPNITDVHVPDYVGLYHPGNLSANISDNNLQLVSMMLYDYHNITFNQSLVVWYYLDDSGESGTYVISEYTGTYANLNQTENSTPASLIMLSNWTQNDKVYILANFKKNQTASWAQIFLEFNLSNGLLNNLAIPSISQLNYITNLIEPGVSIVYPFALILDMGWTVLDLNCNYTLYSIGDPNNPYLSFSPLENGEYTGLIQAQDTEYNMNSTSYNLSVNHSLPPNNPPNTPSNPDPSNGSTEVIITPTLSWTGGDPDGDPVTYDVYFGNVTPPPQIEWNQTETTYNPGTLDYNTQYYWKIVAWDNHGASTDGPTWSFTTEDEQSSPPAVVYVDDDYNSSTPGWMYDHFDSIQDGINAVSWENGTVYVFNGTYHENLNIYRKYLTLVGENKNTTIIDANGVTHDAIYIGYSGDHNLVSGFTIRNTKGSGVCMEGNVNAPDYFLASSHNTISDCIIYDNGAYGVLIHATSRNCHVIGNTVSNCIIFNNFADGIYLLSWGVKCQVSSTIITNCTLFNNSAGGILQCAAYDHSSVDNSTITGCNIKNNYYGVKMKIDGDNYNQNQDHIIYQNNFINNAQNAFDPYHSTWYNSILHKGNYWSDYTGLDINHDGIGDTPYNITGGNNQDLYPLINPCGEINRPPFIPSNPTPTNGATGIEITSQLNWIGGDPDSTDVITYDVYFGSAIQLPQVEWNQTETTYNPGTLDYNTQYYWKIVAWDNHGASSEASAWNFTTHPEDTEPPSKVIGLTVTDAKDEKLDISWNTATDNVAVAYYRLYRDNIPLINTTDASTSYQDTGLTNGQSYSYEVSAVDTSGNEGERSDSVSGTPTASSSPPSPPSPPSSLPPEANASASETFGFVNAPISFDGSLSSADGTITNYSWDFGDGTTGYGMTTTHVFVEPGTYTVTLTVTDDTEASDDDAIQVVISQPNNPPDKPEINGTTSGHKGTDYNYSAGAIDPDNDTIRYIFDWDDGTNNTISSFLASGEIFNVTHNWTSAGLYTINVSVEDDKNATSGNRSFVVLIDGRYVGNLGYFIDNEGDGIYDSFFSNETGYETLFELQDDGIYLIDFDGDGTCDYTYDSVNKTITSLGGVDEVEGKEKGTTRQIPGIMIVGIIVAIVIIAVVVIVYKKVYCKKKQKENKKKSKKK